MPDSWGKLAYEPRYFDLRKFPMNFDVISLSHLLGVWVNSDNAGEQRHPRGCSGFRLYTHQFLHFSIVHITQTKEIIALFCVKPYFGFFFVPIYLSVDFTKAWRRTLPIGGDWAGNIQGLAESPGKCPVHRWRLLGSGMQKPERLQFSTRCFVYFSLHMEAGHSPLSVPVTHFQSPPYAHLEAGRGRWTQGIEEFSLTGSTIPVLLCDGGCCGRLNIPIAFTTHPCLG